MACLTETCPLAQLMNSQLTLLLSHSCQVDLESLYALNHELYKKVEKPISKIPAPASVML